MSCNRISRECGVCKNIISVISATITAGKLVLNIPAGTYSKQSGSVLIDITGSSSIEYTNTSGYNNRRNSYTISFY